MALGIKQSDRSLAEQAADLRHKFPHFEVTLTYQLLKVIGYIQPTARSSHYQFEIKYTRNTPPTARILSPLLQKSNTGEPVPHTYPGDKLCLYYPAYGEFKRTDSLGDTIIPWISLWLYHYEIWHMTGQWLGGGIHPGKKAHKKNTTISSK